MPFPALREHVDARGLFVVQDPELRSKIMPLFSFDPRDPGERPIGHGTTFRIDPWGSCATAFHLIEELLTLKGDRAVLREGIRLSALEIEGFGYGRFALPKDCWRAISDMFSVIGIETRPLSLPELRNATELANLIIGRSPGALGEMPFLPVDLRRWEPKIGDRVMALGFADLDVDHRGEGDARSMTQYLYGSEAVITQVDPADGTSSRPWPRFRVEEVWPGGMSGGPVFNEAGHVIGLVSAGVSTAASGQDVGTATHFSGWNLSERTFPSLDASNPGWLKCWIAFDVNQKIVGIGPSKESAAPLVTDGKAKDVQFAAYNPVDGSYVIIR